MRKLSKRLALRNKKNLIGEIQKKKKKKKRIVQNPVI